MGESSLVCAFVQTQSKSVQTKTEGELNVFATKNFPQSFAMHFPLVIHLCFLPSIRLLSSFTLIPHPNFIAFPHHDQQFADPVLCC
jgi:hypothetical protein